jgi:mycothiol synthase
VDPGATQLTTMHCELPPGHSARPPAVDDAEAIWRFVAARNEAILGFADVTIDEVVDELTEPGFDPATDGWLVHEPGGAVAGYGWACRKGGSGEVLVDSIAEPDAIAAWLWERTIARAVEIAGATGHAQATLDVGVYRADAAQRARAASLGFQPGTTYHRMRIDHDGPHAAPPVPDSIQIRSGDDPQVRRDGHTVLNAAFDGQFGYVTRPFDEWHAMVDASSACDWSQLHVVYADGRPVAMLRGTNQFVEDEHCGYVATVGVLESARGRGLAKLLLRHAFAADSVRGRAGTILHVDTNNPTPALGLYESVGMRPVLVIDILRRVIPLSVS